MEDQEILIKEEKEENSKRMIIIINLGKDLKVDLAGVVIKDQKVMVLDKMGVDLKVD